MSCRRAYVCEFFWGGRGGGEHWTMCMNCRDADMPSRARTGLECMAPQPAEWQTERGVGAGWVTVGRGWRRGRPEGTVQPARHDRHRCLELHLRACTCDSAQGVTAASTSLSSCRSASSTVAPATRSCCIGRPASWPLLPPWLPSAAAAAAQPLPPGCAVPAGLSRRTSSLAAMIRREESAWVPLVEQSRSAGNTRAASSAGRRRSRTSAAVSMYCRTLDSSGLSNAASRASKPAGQWRAKARAALGFAQHKHAPKPGN